MRVEPFIKSRAVEKQIIVPIRDDRETEVSELELEFSGYRVTYYAQVYLMSKDRVGEYILASISLRWGALCEWPDDVPGLWNLLWKQEPYYMLVCQYVL